MKSIITILVFVAFCCEAQQPPSSAGKPTYPPFPMMPVYYPYPTNMPHQQQFAVGTEFIPNGEWKVVCRNYDCGATNKVMPMGTNRVVIETGTGGRNVEHWLKIECPVCSFKFTNRYESVWVVDVPPLPVLVATNMNGVSTNKTQR